MTALLSTSSRRIAFAIALSLLVHGWFILGPGIRPPQHTSFSQPPLMAKLQQMPTAPHKLLPKIRRHSPPVPAPDPEPPTAAEIPPASTNTPTATDVAATNIASAVSPAATMAATPTVERPLLPHRAQLTFAVNKGTGTFQIGEAIHTMEIEDGHYVLQSITKTVGMARLFKNYQLTQYSSGNYVPQQGLQPEYFFEERIEQADTHRTTVDFDHTAQRAHFSSGVEAPLPPDTQDILSIMYQFPPLENTEIVVSVSNSKKIERYEFEITANEEIYTALGKLQTVHLRKLHQPNEDGLEIWLAQEYRLFPVKIRIIERNGEISGEIIITDIRVEDAPQETTPNATN